MTGLRSLMITWLLRRVLTSVRDHLAQPLTRSAASKGLNMGANGLEFAGVKGLPEALANPSQSNISTIYSYDTADKTFDLIERFKGEGGAIFTQPFGVVKCAGGEYTSSHPNQIFLPSSTSRSFSVQSCTYSRPAPQKIAYMADAYWKSTNTPIRSTFITGMPTMFSVPHYSKVLNGIREQKGIAGEFNTNLVEVRPADKVAVFEYTTGDKKGQRVEKEFGFLHVTPPMGPLDSVKKSPLADGAGWVDVDQGTLQHKKYENVFSLGDASSLPTSKVGDVPVLYFRSLPFTRL